MVINILEPVTVVQCDVFHSKECYTTLYNLMKHVTFFIQFGGAFMLKAPGYQMVQENSKYNDSYFYQIDHASRKSFFNIFTLGSGVPYMRQEGLPGKF